MEKRQPFVLKPCFGKELREWQIKTIHSAVVCLRAKLIIHDHFSRRMKDIARKMPQQIVERRKK